MHRGCCGQKNELQHGWHVTPWWIQKKKTGVRTSGGESQEGEGRKRERKGGAGERGGGEEEARERRGDRNESKKNITHLESFRGPDLSPSNVDFFRIMIFCSGKNDV